jgi:hypothetical protein
MTKKICFLGIAVLPKIRILLKVVRLEASTKPPVHQKFEIFWTNIASTMACLNFKIGPKNGLRPLGVNNSEFRYVQFDEENGW